MEQNRFAVTRTLATSGGAAAFQEAGVVQEAPPGSLPIPVGSPSRAGSVTRKVLVKQIPTKQLVAPTLPVSSGVLSASSSMQQALSALTAQQQQAFLRSLAQNPTAPLGQAPLVMQAGPAAAPASQPVKSKLLLPKAPSNRAHVDSPHPSTVTASLPPLLGVSGVSMAGGQKVVAPVSVPPAQASSRGRSHSRSSDGGGSTVSAKPRKPCNCKNSQCLKLYCDCFANGEFCRETCNCQNCKNSLQYEDDRSKAVKSCLDRNPNAFKPKVGQCRSGDERRHIKGCNCRKSSCLKNYCECYEAKIACSSLCRCVGCQNLPDRPERKSLMQLADAADIRTQQQKAASTHFLEQLHGTNAHMHSSGHKLPFSFVNKEVAKATCLCLLEEASHAAMSGKSAVEVEKIVLVEFGNCLEQIIAASETANQVARPVMSEAT